MELRDKLFACDAAKGEDKKGPLCQKELPLDLRKKCAVPESLKKVSTEMFL